MTIDKAIVDMTTMYINVDAWSNTSLYTVYAFYRYVLISAATRYYEDTGGVVNCV